MSLTACVPTKAAFGEYIGPWTRPGRERPRHDLFGVTEAINRGGVDPVHAQLERSVNRGDGIVIALLSPGELPAGAADCPRAEAHGSDKQIGISKLFRFH